MLALADVPERNRVRRSLRVYRMKRTVLTAIVVVAVAACQAPAQPEVATAQTPAVAPSTPGAAPAQETDYDKALRYTRCMTDNGFPIKDPVEGVMLEVGLMWGAGETIETIERRRAAWEICKQLLPRTWPVKLDQAEIDRSRDYVLCMRENGIPEPLADANGMVDHPTGDQLYRMPGYDQAVAKCRHLVDDPANDHQP